MERPPNILLVLTDQQRFDTVGAAGNRHIRTPTLDRLAQAGVRFDRCYTSSPVCVPARAGLLTGLLPHRNGCTNNGEPLRWHGPTFLERLRASGYTTCGIGKMHFSPPRRDWGFAHLELSEEIPGSADQDDYLTFLLARGYRHVHEPHGVRSDMYYIPQVSQLPAELHATAWVADRACAFLRGRDPRQPFFLWVSFIKPHPPFDPPVPWNKLYRTVDMPRPFRPAGYRELQTWWMRHQNRYKYREDGPDDTLNRTIKAAYYASISFIDFHVGRILRVLESTGSARETLVIFTSDHGELLGDYGSWGKRSFLDPAARVPLLLYWPGRLRGGTVWSGPVSLLDVPATILAAAGIVQDPGERDGQSLLDLPAVAEPRLVWGQLGRDAFGTYMVTDGQFKYVYSAPDDREYLFSLEEAPEQTNLALDPRRRGECERLCSLLRRRLTQDGYTAPFEGEGWRRFAPPPEPTDPDEDRIFQEAAWTDPWLRVPGYTQPWVPPR